MAVEIPADRVVPGDILVFDYEVLTQQEQLRTWAINRIKEEVWAHPMLDYQSSQTFEVGDLARQQDVTILRVRAQVRTHEKATREQVHEASLGYWLAAGAGFVIGAGGYMLFKSAAKDIGYTIEKAGEALQEGMKWTVLLALIFLAYTLFARE